MGTTSLQGTKPKCRYLGGSQEAAFRFHIGAENMPSYSPSETERDTSSTRDCCVTKKTTKQATNLYC